MHQVTQSSGTPERVLSLSLAFPIGLPGFEDHHSFTLFGLGPEFGPYLGLRSTIEGGPTFVVVQPSEVGIEMAVDIDDFCQSLLGIRDASEVIVFVIATLGVNGESPTVNTQAPLVINVSNWRCAQVLQGNQAYSMRESVDVLFRDESRMGEAYSEPR